MNPGTDPHVHTAEELAFIAVSKLLAINAAARARRQAAWRKSNPPRPAARQKKSA